MLGGTYLIVFPTQSKFITIKQAEVYSTYNISTGDTEFIDYRNDLIHTGNMSFPNIDEKIEKKYLLENTIERLLLNILEYHGEYWDNISETWVDKK